MLRQVSQASGGVLKPWGYVSPEVVDQDSFREFLDLWGVRYLMVRSESSQPLARHYEQIGSLAGASVFENEQARPRLFAALSPEDITQETFEGRLSMSGYALARDSPQGGNHPGMALHTWWQCQNSLSKDYTLYVHYLDEAGELIGQDDHMLGMRSLSESFPTSSWRCPGYYWDVSYVPTEALRDNELRVALGLWIPETGERLEASGELAIDEFGRVGLEIEGVDEVTTPPGEIYFDEYGHAWLESRGRSSSSATVELLHYEGDRIGADVDFQRDGVLIHATSYVPGWRATVDGVPEPIVQVAGFLQAVVVPEGHHRVELWYAPASVKWGCGLSLCSLALLILLCLGPLRPRSEAN
jgi:hypothetical protein